MSADNQPIDRYQIGECVGVGGMGSVYRVTDRLKQSTLALKKLRVRSDSKDGKHQDSSQRRLQLAHEFGILAQLRHPNIISVLDYGFDENRQPFFTMEMLEDTINIVDYGRDQTFEKQIDLLIQTLQALIYLHRNSVIHCDLKPDNVLIDDGVVKVLDFGLAHRYNYQDAAQDGLMAGTIAYIAPEVLQGHGVSEASDLYALGLIAYEMFAGEHPFDVQDITRLLQQVVTETPNTGKLTVPEPVSAILEQLLQKNPARRPQNAEIVLDRLARATGRKIKETRRIRESFLQAAKFVGREAELAQLISALRWAAEKKGSTWLVGGESGIGKSRLLEELRIRALVDGFAVLRGQGVQEGGLPFQVWRDVVRRLVLTSDVTPTEASILKEIVPDIAQLIDEEVSDAPEADARTAQQRLILTIAELCLRQTRPTLLILEDLHWASASLEPLKRVAADIGAHPLLVVGSYRNDERPNLHQDELSAMQHLLLDRLPPDAIAELSMSMLGEAGQRRPVLDLLQAETEGNVFFLVEVVRALSEESGRLSDVGRITLPEKVFTGGVLEIAQRRLQHIPLDAQPMLRVAAVAGRHLDMELLRFIDDEMDYDDWLMVCANAALLEVKDGQWRFAHDRLRDGILYGLDPNVRQNYHAMIADSIETLRPNDETYHAQLVEHWHAANDIEKELGYVRQLVERALDQSNFRDAMRLSERTLRRLPEDRQIGAELMTMAGNAAYGLGDYSTARQYFDQAIELARQYLDRYVEAVSLMGLGRISGNIGHYAVSRVYLEDSLAIFRQLDDPSGIARCRNDMFTVAYLQGDYTEAETHTVESLKIYRELDDSKGIANNLIFLCSLAQHRQDYALARQHAQEALTLFEKVDNQQGIGLSYYHLGAIAYRQGSYEAALKDATESLDTYRVVGDRLGIADVLILLGMIHLEMDAHEQAAVRLKEALTLTSRIGVTPMTLKVLAGFARYHLRRDETRESARMLGTIQARHESRDKDLQIIVSEVRGEIQKQLSREETFRLEVAGRAAALEDVVSDLLMSDMGRAG